MSRSRALFSLIFVLVLGALLTATAQADDNLRDRYIAASQAMGENMLKMLQSCAPDVDMSEVDFDYTPKMIDSVDCVIDAHIERLGRDATVELVEQAEAMGERSFSSLREMAAMQEQYPRLASPAMQEITMECGTIEASRDLPLSRLMQDNMAEMAACFSQQ